MYVKETDTLAITTMTKEKNVFLLMFCLAGTHFGIDDKVNLKKTGCETLQLHFNVHVLPLMRAWPLPTWLPFWHLGEHIVSLLV